MKREDLKSIALPEAPGVYFFRDIENRILYIGKATILKDRVRSYFNPDLNKTRGLKIISMVLNAHTVTWAETPSVLEALILETNLIKKYKPTFNTKEKDDKSYNCVVITKEAFPRVLTVRTRNVFEDMKKDIKETFGPFPSGQALRETLKIVRRIFPFRDTCTPMVGKQCFNAQIGLCPGVCDGSCDQKSYAQQVRNVISFFKGNKDEIVKRLTKDMSMYAKAQEFEQANRIKKTLYALTHIRDSSLIKHTFSAREDLKVIRIEGYDVAHISGSARVGVMVVIENGEPQKASYRKFKLPQGINDDYEGLRELLTRRLKHVEWQYPDLIVIDGGKGQQGIAREVLASMNLNIPWVAVVKDERHKPKSIEGDETYKDTYKQEILLTNSESHRFAMSYHTQLRNNDFLKIKDGIRKGKTK